jgi:hypothetical protein
LSVGASTCEERQVCASDSTANTMIAEPWVIEVALLSASAAE